MVSIEKCRKVLKDSGNKFSDDELKNIRRLIYEIATIEYESFKKPNKNSSNLHKSIN